MAWIGCFLPDDGQRWETFSFESKRNGLDLDPAFLYTILIV